MKKFILKIIKFFLLLIALLAITETLLFIGKSKLMSEKNLEKVYNSQYEYSWVNLVEGDSLIVLAGSSSVKFGLSCTELDNLSDKRYKFVNIAMNGRDPIETYFILKNMNPERISTVYFGLDPWIYTKSYYRHRDSYMYLEFSFLDALNYYFDYDKSIFAKRYKKLIYYTIIPVKKKRNENLIIPSDFGSVAMVGNPVNFDTDINSWFDLKYGWSDLQFIYLKKIVDLCAERNIRFKVFIPPKRSDFSKIYKKELDSVHLEYTQLLEGSILNIPVFGKFDQLDNLGDSLFFAEAFHLNKEGQKEYSGLFLAIQESETSRFSKNYNWFTKK